MRLWEQKWVIGLNKRNAPNVASKFCTIIRTEIDNFVFPIYTLTLRYFSNTFHHDSAPARPRSREIRALLLNVRRRPIARWKAYLNSYALSTKRAISLGEPDNSFLLSEPHIYIWSSESKNEISGSPRDFFYIYCDSWTNIHYHSIFYMYQVKWVDHSKCPNYLFIGHFKWKEWN